MHLVQTINNRQYVVERPSLRIDDQWYLASLSMDVSIGLNWGDEEWTVHAELLRPPDNIKTGDNYEVECLLDNRPVGWTWLSYIWDSMQLISSGPSSFDANKWGMVFRTRGEPVRRELEEAKTIATP